MIPKRESPASAAADPGQSRNTQDLPAERSATAPGKQQPKWQRVLRGFIDRGLRGWNRFEAARELRDHVLPTTVSQLELRGLTLLRREESVPGAFGEVRCARYWLSPESVALAWQLLGGLPGEAQGASGHPAAEALCRTG